MNSRLALWSALALAGCGKSGSSSAPAEPRPVASAPGVAPVAPTKDHTVELVGGQVVDGTLVLFTQHSSGSEIWGEVHGFDGTRVAWTRRGVGLAGTAPIAIDKDIAILDGKGQPTRTIPLPALEGDRVWARSGDRLYAIRTGDGTVTSFQLGDTAAQATAKHAGALEVRNSTLVPAFARAFGDGIYVPCDAKDGDHALCRAPATGGEMTALVPSPVRDAAATADKLFVAGKDALIAYSSTGDKLWQVPATAEHWPTRVAASGSLVALIEERADPADHKNRFYRVSIHDAATGKERWSRVTPVGGESFGRELAVGDDRVAYTSNLGGIIVVDGAGKELHRFDLKSELVVTSEFAGGFAEILHGDLVIAGKYLAVIRGTGLEVHSL